MAHIIYETTTHDFDPVNKYIYEKARLRRTKSTWRYTKALALFLLAFGLFLILAAYAYHIFKKPHDRFFTNDRVIKSDEGIKQNFNNEILNKEKKIQDLQKELNTNPENQRLQEELEKIEKEKEALESRINDVVYNTDAVVFEKQTIGDFTITTGFSWNTVDDLRYGKKHVDDWCYLRKNGTTFDYYYGRDGDTGQNINLNAMNITRSEAESYKKYCSN